VRLVLTVQTANPIPLETLVFPPGGVPVRSKMSRKKTKPRTTSSESSSGDSASDVEAAATLDASRGPTAHHNRANHRRAPTAAPAPSSATRIAPDDIPPAAFIVGGIGHAEPAALPQQKDKGQTHVDAQHNAASQHAVAGCPPSPTLTEHAYEFYEALTKK
jgi:hypothetical protein